MTTRVLCYLRQSDSDGAGERSLSLDSQATVLRADAERFDWRVVAEIRDADLKGYDDQRPGLLELYDRCREGSVDMVAVWKLDRLARLLRLQENVLHELDQLGVLVYSNQDPHLGTPLFRQVLGAFNEELTRMISANVRRAVRERQHRGLHQGRIPYGYRQPDPHQPLAIDPEPAAVVRELFARRAAGEGPAALARDLTERGIPTPRGSVWHATSVTQVLSSVAHRGAIRCGAGTIEQAHEPIIDSATWHAAQRSTSVSRSRSPRRKPVASWLEGMIEHACGAPMYLVAPTPPRTSAYFRCGRRVIPPFASCGIGQSTIRAHLAEPLAWRRLSADLERILPPGAVLGALRAELRRMAPDALDARHAAQRRQKHAHAARERAIELYLDGAIDRARYERRLADAAAAGAAADAVLREGPRAPERSEVEAAWRRLRGVRDVLASIEGMDRAPVLRELGVVVVGPDGVTVRYTDPWPDFLRDDDHTA